MKKLQLYAVLLLLAFGITTIPKTIQAQQLPAPVTYTEKGEAKGFIRVKMKDSAAAILQLSPIGMNTNAKIGIAAFDATSTHFEAHNMQRVFPFDARHEHKLQKHGLHLWYQIEIDPSVDPHIVAEAFSKIAEVDLSEPILEKKIIGGYKKAKVLSLNEMQSMNTQSAVTSNDPLLENQWHYANDGQGGFLENASINLLEAWATTQGDRKVIISVHDEGIDINHEDLKDNIWINTAELNGEEGVDSDGNGYIDDVYGYNFANNTAVIDAMEHGTHVSGTVAAVNNNGIGVAGVAGGSGNQDGALIMPCQILGGRYNNTAASFVYAANNGAVISQNSWGWTSPGVYEQATLDAIDYFIAEAGDFEGSPMKGGVVIVASGNSDIDAEFYPAYYDKCIAVSSTGGNREKAWYSNYGDWIELTAPGGDQSTFSNHGVLSTLPGNKYGFLQGTSMACPHVSGVAALVLSQMGNENYTPDLLWNQLLSSTHNIDAENPSYSGKMGTGLLDASLAVIENSGVAPAVITDLGSTGITDQIVQLEWTVPADEDDGQPSKYFIYKNEGETIDLTIEPHVFFSQEVAGEKITFTVENLTKFTQYAFAITAVDRWGNSSEVSETLVLSTNEGPSMTYPEAPNSWTFPVDLSVDVTQNTIGETTFEIGNTNDALLTWEITAIRQTGENVRTWDVQVPYVGKTAQREANISSQSIIKPQILKAETPEDIAPFEEEYLSYSVRTTPEMIIGETDLSLPNATASAFMVTNEKGFNLTDAKVWLNELTVGHAIVEVYVGSNLSTAEKVLEKEIEDTSFGTKTVSFDNDETQFFPYGSVLWLVYKIPAGNLYPVGIGTAVNNPDRQYQWMSFDDGETWEFFADLYGSNDYAFIVSLESDKQYAGEHITLTPLSGQINGTDSIDVQFTADASKLKNGYVQSNLILQSNDPSKEEVRIPVKVNIAGHIPNVVAASLVDFGSVQIGREKQIIVQLDNYGYGVFKGGLTWDYNQESNFTITDKPHNVKPRSSEDFVITFAPTVGGNMNEILTITDRDGFSVELHLFGNGEEPAEIAITPLEQTFTTTLGASENGSVTIANTGNYPLTFSIPKYSDQLPEGEHRFGYSWEKYVDAGAWQEIDGTEDVIDYTETFKSNPFLDFVKVDLGFDFPYYDTLVSEMYLSHIGLIAIDDKDPVNGSFGQLLGRDFTSNGYIAFLYEYMDYSPTSKILFKQFDDRVIAEYKDMLPKQEHGRSQDLMTFQVVLFYNGNIEMRYKDMGWGNTNATDPFVGLESPDKKDGFYIYEFVAKPEKLFEQTPQNVVVRVNHPGPNIISNLSQTDGTIPSGGSVDITYAVNTESLVEGMNIQNIAIVNNDPLQPIAHFTVKADIIDGGVSELVTSDRNIQLNEVFRSAEKQHNIGFINKGSAIISIASATIGSGVDSKFSIDRSTFDILPRLGTNVKVTLNTDEVGVYNDVITFVDADGESYIFNISATVVTSPSIALDQTPLSFDLNVGETANFSVDITNNGDADLEVLPSGTTWIYEQTAHTLSIPSLPEFTYAWKDNKDQLDGAIDPNAPKFQWLDITSIGTELEIDQTELFWKEVDLPFELPFWNQSYNKIYVGYHGIMTFTEPTDYCPPFNIEIPNADTAPHNFIAPLWSNVGEDYFDEDPRKGTWMWSDNEKVVITYERYVHYYGAAGGYVSAQTIFYKNGTIKVQYKTIDQAGVNIFNKYFTLGLENEDGTHGVVNNFYRPYITDGLAVEYAPAKKTTIPVGTSATINFTVDAKDLLGGAYTHELAFVNQTPGEENIAIPVTVNVTGEYELVWNDTLVDFGTIISNGAPLALSHEFELQNIGTDVYTLLEDELSYSEGFGDMMNGEGPGFWCKLIEIIPSPWPAQEQWSYPFVIFSKWFGTEDPIYESITIAPKSHLKVKVDFSANGLGEVEKFVTVKNSDGTDVTIRFKVNVIAPPVFEYNGAASYEVNALTNTHQEVKSFEISNVNGESPLEYYILPKFNRNVTTVAKTNTTAINVSALTHQKVVARQVHNVIDDSEYHAVLRYDNKSAADQSIGYAGASLTTITAFDAPIEGFDLSHVATWFTPKGTIDEGEITVNTYTGSPSNPLLLSTESFAQNIAEMNEEGDIIVLELENKVTFYGGEKVFVEIVYPAGIDYPQGIVAVDNRIQNTFFIPMEDGWYDLTNEGNWERYAFMVRALAKDEISGSWLSLNHSQGAIAAGESLQIDASFDAQYALTNEVYATIEISSNDPAQEEEVSIPVQMSLNQAPIFADFEGHIEIAEAEEVTLNYVAEDLEGHQITYAVNNLGAIGTATINDGITVTLSPTYEMAGEYTFEIVATDEHGLSSTEEIAVTITNTNRAPIGVEMDTVEIILGEIHYIDPTTVFTDEDGDELTYSIANNNDGIVVTGIANGEFIISSIAEGSNEVALFAYDGHTSTIVIVPVKVIQENPDDGITAIDDLVSTIKLTNYPNPAVSSTTISFTLPQNGAIQVIVHNNNGQLVDQFDLGQKAAGKQEMAYNVNHLPSGLYFYTLVIDGKTIAFGKLMKK